jgi:hypothetical protein
MVIRMVPGILPDDGPAQVGPDASGRLIGAPTWPFWWD